MGQPTYKKLQDMKYLEMVIKESLLYPTGPVLGREITEDDSIRKMISISSDDAEQ